MSFHIAVTGKGGVGKTSVSALIVSRLIAAGRVPVLAVDADPNSCLHLALGIELRKSIGTVREEARAVAAQGMKAGISKHELLELKIAESLVEATGFDFLAMGRPEGPGCYCYANNVLKSVLETIASQYPFVVLDNEAGLENLSRRIMQKMDLLIMVTEPTRQGYDTVRRLHGLALEMQITFRRLAIVVNRARTPELPAPAIQLQKDTGADHLVVLPEDSTLAAQVEQGRPVSELPASNPVVSPVDAFLHQALASAGR